MFKRMSLLWKFLAWYSILDCTKYACCMQLLLPRLLSEISKVLLIKQRILTRILAAAQGQPDDWITAYPIAHVGTRLDNETLRVNVALRVCLNVCLEHQCRCGATVQPDSLHPLSCRFSAGRFPRHSVNNDIIERSRYTAGLHSILELVGLDRGDGRRQDGVTSFPFKGGKALLLLGTGLGRHLY